MSEQEGRIQEGDLEALITNLERTAFLLRRIVDGDHRALENAAKAAYCADTLLFKVKGSGVMSDEDPPGTVEAHGEKRARPNCNCEAFNRQMLDALKDAQIEIEQMLEDLCDEPDEDVGAHRTLATIKAAIAAAEPD